MTPSSGASAAWLDDALAALEEAALDGVPARELSALLYAVLGEPALAHRPRGGAPRDAALSTR
ncbi:hypothetical protein LUW77_02605 [Streptomyces radiopugnans]|nr:hypothetical protein LUW77_02605 [Streptomyces radiopugnans]